MAKEDIPLLARRCWSEYRSATQQIRTDEEESIGMWLGGKHQWRPGEIVAREGNNRPWTTINRVKPAVDQIENEARSNPPGPEADPVGLGADKDGADILEGLIREYSYRSSADASRITALRYAMAGGRGCWELATDYRNERSDEQCLVVKEIEDPAMCFYDPNARMRHLQDAMWQGKIRILTREQLKEQYPDANLKIFSQNTVDQAVGWMKDALGFGGNDRATFIEWVGGARGQGPYYVCEFWRVTIKKEKKTLYSDHIHRFESEKIPPGVTPMLDEDGEEISRIVPRRKVTKHICTALDEIVEPIEWPGSIIPIFWVLGPKIYLKGKLYVLSLITSAIGAQRSLNYTATSMNEIVGLMTKTPWVGWEGQFDTQNAQGFNPWENSNTQVYAYLEIKPKFAINPTTQQAELLPAPQRNSWEAPIARLFEALTFWGEQIKAATSVFFDPSQQNVADVQSGEAIKALQSQTNIGTLDWQASLRSACSLEFQEAARILPQIMDGPRVVTIVRPDSKHELVEINREFPPDRIDPATGKKGKRNSILGEYSLRVSAGPSFDTRNKEAIQRMMDFVKIAPQVLGAPGVAGQFLRMLGEGNPEVEQMADALSPSTNGEQTPQQLQQQLATAAQQNKALTIVVQKLQMALAAKLPDVEARKFAELLDSITKIRVAEINASKDSDNANADRLADLLEHLTGLAHETAMQATEHQHASDMQDSQQAAATAAQASDQAPTQQQQEPQGVTQ